MLADKVISAIGLLDLMHMGSFLWTQNGNRKDYIWIHFTILIYSYSPLSLV